MPLSAAIQTVRRSLPTATSFRPPPRSPPHQTFYCALHGDGSHSTTQCRALAAQRRPFCDDARPATSSRGYAAPRRSRRQRGGGRRNYFRPQASASFMEDDPDAFLHDHDATPTAFDDEPTVRTAVASDDANTDFMCLCATACPEPRHHALVTQDPTSGPCGDNSWALDSGANLHLCRHFDWLLDPSPVNVNVRLAGKGHLLTATHVGHVKIALGSTNVKLSNVYYSQDLAGNLLSVRDLASKDVLSLFDVDHVITMKRDGTTLAMIPYTNGRYSLEAPALQVSGLPTPPTTRVAEQATLNPQKAKMTSTSATQTADTPATPDAPPSSPPISNSINAQRDWELLHRRLGHLSDRKMRQVARFGLLRDLRARPTHLSPCEICACAKAKRLPFSGKHGIYTTRPLQGLSVDILGPVSMPSAQNHRYALVIVDNYTRRYFAYGLTNRTEAPHVLISFILEKENELGLPIQWIISDNAMEFNARGLTDFLTTRGIQHRYIAPATPTENALAERAVGVLTQMTRCLLLESALPAHFWEFALHFAVYVHNVTPCTALPPNTTPMIRWNGRLPTYRHHRTFGSIVYVFQQPLSRLFKFSPTAQQGVFLGYASQRGGYLIWLPTLNKVIISRHVQFDEERRIVYRHTDVHSTQPQPQYQPTAHSSDSSSTCSTTSHSDDSDDPPAPPPPPDSPTPSTDRESIASAADLNCEEPERPPTPPLVNPDDRLRTLRSWSNRPEVST